MVINIVCFNVHGLRLECFCILSAVCVVKMCLSFCLSHLYVASKWLNWSSNKQCLEIYLSCDPVKDLKDIDDFE